MYLPELTSEQATRTGFVVYCRAFSADAIMTADAPSPDVVAAVMDAFSLYRRGFGSRAIVALRRPGALELLTALDPHLVGGADRFLAD